MDVIYASLQGHEMLPPLAKCTFGGSFDYTSPIYCETMSANEDRGVRKIQKDGRPLDQNAPAKVNDNSGNNIHRKVSKAAPHDLVQSKNRIQSTSSPGLPVSDDHASKIGFNSAEVDTLLKKAVDLSAPIYKPEPQTQPTKSSPWGSKPSAMAGGRDFFLELRKQVTALQQSGGVSQGG